jgi:hypothetical protein
MPATGYTPFGPNTYNWDTTATTFRGAPVVLKGSALAYGVTNPAGTGADIIVGVAMIDAGPSVPASEQAAASITAIPVQEFGVVAMYAKGAINPGQAVKVGATISVTPPGYSAAITIFTATAATQALAGAQPFPIIGFAVTPASADGDIVYVRLTPGQYY